MLLNNSRKKFLATTYHPFSQSLHTDIPVNRFTKFWSQDLQAFFTFFSAPILLSFVLLLRSSDDGYDFSFGPERKGQKKVGTHLESGLAQDYYCGAVGTGLISTPMLFQVWAANQWNVRTTADGQSSSLVCRGKWAHGLLYRLRLRKGLEWLRVPATLVTRNLPNPLRGTRYWLTAREIDAGRGISWLTS